MAQKVVPKKPGRKKTAAKKAASKRKAPPKRPRTLKEGQRYLTEQELQFAVDSGLVRSALFRTKPKDKTGARWWFVALLPKPGAPEQVEEAILSTARSKKERYFHEGAAVRLAERLGLPTACFQIGGKA